MWAILKLILPAVLKLFGLGPKDERDTERQAGRDLGRAESGRAAAESELHDIAQADAGRRAVSDDPAAIVRDADNLGAAKP